MNPELVAQYDDAARALDGFATPEGEDSAAIQACLAREVAESGRTGARTWFARWVLAPLGALRVFDALQRGLLSTLAEARLELSRLDEEISRLRAEGRGTEGEPLARRRAELLCHQAALAARLEGARARQTVAARDRIARRLEVALRFTAQEAALSARDILRETSASVQRVLGKIEGYDRLAREARSLANGLDLPCFLPEDVARLRSAASLGALRLEVMPVDGQPPATDSAPVSLRALRAPADGRALRTA